MTQNIDNTFNINDLNDFLSTRNGFSNKKEDLFSILILKLFDQKQKILDNKINIEKIDEKEGHYKIGNFGDIQDKKREDMYQLLKGKSRISMDEYNFIESYKNGALKSRINKNIFILNKEYIAKIEKKSGGLTKEDLIKLEIAYMITQQAFSRTIRKDGFTPYFKHIKGTTDNVLMLNKIEVDQSIISILHDTLEDIDYQTYDIIENTFEDTISKGVLALTEKRRYHRIGFLPLKKREKLQKFINYFTGNLNFIETNDIKNYFEKKKHINIGNIHKEIIKWNDGTDGFIDMYNQTSPRYLGINETFNLPKIIEDKILSALKSPKNFYEIAPKFLEYDPEYLDIYNYLHAISEYRYLNKRLDGDLFKEKDILLPIKFSDRINNNSSLWLHDQNKNTILNNPGKRVPKLIETEYHFLNNDNEIKNRLEKHPIDLDNIQSNIQNIVPKFMGNKGQLEFLAILDNKKPNGNFTHYDILEAQLELIKNNDPEITKTIKNGLYDEATKLYKNQNLIIKEIEIIRKQEKQGNFTNKENTILSDKYCNLIDTIYKLRDIYKKMDNLK